MKLSDYTGGVRAVTEARGSDAEAFEVSRKKLRDCLYEKVASEHIAKLAALGGDQARAELSAVIDQVANECGVATDDAPMRSRLVAEMLDMVLGLGPLERLLEDATVTEIMVNGAKSIFIERDGRLQKCEEAFASEEQLRLVVDRIVSPLGRRVDDQQPIVNARLAQGHRVNAVIPPVSMKGTALTIRKFREVSFTLDELVENDTLDESMSCLLRWAIRMRKNLAVSGGTGGGKTTLLNALSREIDPAERIITIEDSAELRFDKHPHVVQMEARMANAEGNGEITIRDLVINALRMRPDRIIVGECRGAEALDMLQAMNTGHDGSLTTLHANSPAEVVQRLVMMVRYGMDLPTQVIEMQIASALNMIVQQDRLPGGKRRITQIVCRDAIMRGGAETPESMFTPCVVWDRRACEYRWLAYPAWVEDVPYAGVASTEEVDRWLCGLH